jgi:hypothetical protein
MPIGPPERPLVSEAAIAAAIFVGAFSASWLAALCLSAVPMALLRSTDEGALFLQPAVSNCIGLLVNPVIFATFAGNHCRRVPLYFTAVTPLLWLMQFGFFWRQHLMVPGEPFGVAVCTIVGLGLGYWVLRRKERGLGSETNALP